MSVYSRLVLQKYDMKGQRPILRERRFQVYEEVGKSDDSSYQLVWQVDMHNDIEDDRWQFATSQALQIGCWKEEGA